MKVQELDKQFKEAAGEAWLKQASKITKIPLMKKKNKTIVHGSKEAIKRMEKAWKNRSFSERFDEAIEPFNEYCCDHSDNFRHCKKLLKQFCQKEMNDLLDRLEMEKQVETDFITPINPVFDEGYNFAVSNLNKQIKNIRRRLNE